MRRGRGAGEGGGRGGERREQKREEGGQEREEGGRRRGEGGGGQAENGEASNKRGRRGSGTKREEGGGSSLRCDASKHLFSEGEKNVVLFCPLQFNKLLASLHAAAEAHHSFHSFSS